MDQEKIGKFIKEIRKKNNLTQNDLAKMLGVTYQAVSKWENGKNIPDISLLREMSKIFNVDIGEILNGEIKGKTKRKKILLSGGIISAISILIIATILLLGNHSHNFEFKTLTSNCKDFNITGSLAYNKDKTSIYISDINYCGEEDNKIYDELKCTLYEENDSTKNMISSCSEGGKISLTDFLKDVKIEVGDYTSTCKKFSKANLYLEIAASKDNKIITYKVPITMNDSCTK